MTLIEALTQAGSAMKLPPTPDVVVSDASRLLHHAGSISQLAEIRRVKGRLVDMQLETYNSVLSWCNELASKYGCVLNVNGTGVDLHRSPTGATDSPVGDLIFAGLA